MPEQLDHLSYSSVSTWLTCGAKWKFNYIDKVSTKTSPALVFGSAFHGAVEDFITQQVTKPEKPKSIQDLWMENWNEETTVVNEKEEIQPRNDIDWGDTTPEYHCNEGIRLLTSSEIYNSILSIVPGQDEIGTLVERKIELRVPGVPIPIIGYIDVITKDGIPGDLKTAAKSWTEDKASSEMQPLFYLAAMNQMGMPVPDWTFRHYVFVKTKQPKFQLLEHKHNPAQLMWLFRMIQNVWKGIEAEVFPENPGSWLCNSNYCEFWSICRGKYQ